MYVCKFITLLLKCLLKILIMIIHRNIYIIYKGIYINKLSDDET